MLGADRQRLKHIISYCEEIDGFIARFGDDYETFITDRAYFNAVTRFALLRSLSKNGLNIGRTETILKFKMYPVNPGLIL